MKAMEGLNETFVDGRKIRVNEATDKRRSGGGGGGYRGGGDRYQNDGPVVENRRGGYNEDRGRGGYNDDRGRGSRRNRGDR